MKNTIFVKVMAGVLAGMMIVTFVAATLMYFFAGLGA